MILKIFDKCIELKQECCLDSNNDNTKENVSSPLTTYSSN